MIDLTMESSEERVCAAGSKSGDLVLWDTSKKVEGDMIKGRGPGGSVQGLVLD